METFKLNNVFGGEDIGFLLDVPNNSIVLMDGWA